MEGPYLYETYGSAVTIKRYLKEHIQAHREEKITCGTCGTCGSKFSREDNLILQVKIDIGEKPF